MLRALLVTIVFSFTSISQAFINSGDQIVCDGFANQFLFLIGGAISDSNGNALVPRQFSGSFENKKFDEGETGKVTFVEVDEDLFDIVRVDDNSTLGRLEDFGQLAFSRIIRDGAKHLTNCRYREL